MKVLAARTGILNFTTKLSGSALKHPTQATTLAMTEGSPLSVLVQILKNSIYNTIIPHPAALSSTPEFFPLPPQSHSWICTAVHPDTKGSFHGAYTRYVQPSLPCMVSASPSGSDNLFQIPYPHGSKKYGTMEIEGASWLTFQVVG